MQLERKSRTGKQPDGDLSRRSPETNSEAHYFRGRNLSGKPNCLSYLNLLLARTGVVDRLSGSGSSTRPNWSDIRRVEFVQFLMDFLTGECPEGPQRDLEPALTLTTGGVRESTS